MRCLSFLFVATLVIAPAMAGAADVMPTTTWTPAQEQQEIQQWRQERDESLRRADGWLTLVGLEWLKQGINRIGSGSDNDIKLTVGPDYWGSIELDNRALTFVRAAGSDITIDGAGIDGAGIDGTGIDGATPERVALVADDTGEPTMIRSGASGFYVIFRESYALRVFDNQAQALANFKGVQNYDIQPNWRISGRFAPASDGQTIDIGNVLGQVSATPVYGVFEFERDGRQYQLIGLGEETSKNVWFIFSDRTSGKGTYGAGRFLYSEGLPENGRLVVDFNKAYNPPCAFNDYATCPLPPQENRLDLAVTAGEKDAHSTGQ